MPGQANLPRFAPQEALGQDRRPDSGESGEGPGSAAAAAVAVGVFGLSSGSGSGKREERIHVSGWRKMCAQSVTGVDSGRTAWFLLWDL